MLVPTSETEVGEFVSGILLPKASHATDVHFAETWITAYGERVESRNAFGDRPRAPEIRGVHRMDRERCELHGETIGLLLTDVGERNVFLSGIPVLGIVRALGMPTDEQLYPWR